jgi:hypothetical protein
MARLRSTVSLLLISTSCLFGGGAAAEANGVVGRTCPLTGSCSLAGTSAAVPAAPNSHVSGRTSLRRAELAALGAQRSAAAHANGITACANDPGGLPPCKDRDGDGLCDSWEKARRLPNGEPLPGADANKPDIYVQYDWMGYGLPQSPCSVDSECTALGLGHRGETCSGPQVIPTEPASCVHACAVDADCTVLGPSHIGDRCIQSTCQQTHDPEVLSPGALQAVHDSFAAHQINLHIVRGHAVPQSHVLSFRVLNDPNYPLNTMTDTCEGGSVASGTAGAGKYAESFYDLKAGSFDPTRAPAYHYMIFANYSSCDSNGHCAQCVPVPALNPDGSPKAAPRPGQSGIAEILGNDFIVSLGNRINDFGLEPDTFTVGGTFMHELGHNLGLHHGGGVDKPCSSDAECPTGVACTSTPVGNLCLASNEDTYKPNYLSVMNYRYQFTGIQQADAVGSSLPDPALTRLDYSEQTLPSGGDQTLHENGGLSEPAGLGSGTADLFSFSNALCDPPTTAATTGAVDWDGDGETSGMNVTADLSPGDHACGTTYIDLKGSTDWDKLLYKFQCTPMGTEDGSSSLANIAQEELTPEMAAAAHVLYPIRPVQIEIMAGSADKVISPGQQGEFSVALLGTDDLDVGGVELSSLRFHGAAPVSIAVKDVNGDGRLDLLLVLDMADVRLNPNAEMAQLTGWLKNSQAFIGEDSITIAPLRHFGVPLSGPALPEGKCHKKLSAGSMKMKRSMVGATSYPALRVAIDQILKSR